MAMSSPPPTNVAILHRRGLCGRRGEISRTLKTDTGQAVVVVLVVSDVTRFACARRGQFPSIGAIF